MMVSKSGIFFLQISKSIFSGCVALILWDARDALFDFDWGIPN